jgi:hypothetical protein
MKNLDNRPIHWKELGIETWNMELASCLNWNWNLAEEHRPLNASSSFLSNEVKCLCDFPSRHVLLQCCI